MLLPDVIREVSCDLNDQESGYEYTRWVYSQLQSYANEALTTVCLHLPSLFHKTIVVEVAPGNNWQEACGNCHKIIRILGETTEDGVEILRPLARVADDDGMVWTGKSRICSASPYTMRSYSVSDTSSSRFRVYPPLPRTETPRYVLAECVVRPSGFDDSTDVPFEVVPIIKQWMLYRALSVDSENNATITQLAGTHQQTYFKLLDMEIARSRLEDNDAERSVRQNAERAS